MLSYFVWIWLGIVVLTLFVEIMTTEVVSIWFFVGALVALILAICGVDEIIQCWVFIGVSVLFLISVRPFLKKWIKRNEIKTNVDTIVGKIAIVTNEIAPNDRGEVKIDGLLWTAISSEKLNVGEDVVILAIEGNKLIVKAKDSNEKIIYEDKGERK